MKKIGMHFSQTIRSPSRMPKTFTSGFLYGLSSVAMLVAGSIDAPRVPGTNITSDWKAVGGDLRTAIRKYEHSF